MLYVIVRHLHASPLEAALDIETLVGVAAVEDGLVAPDLIRDEVEGVDQSKTQLLALLVLSDGNIFDVANRAEVVDAISAGAWY